MFSIGEYISHPMHGAGMIESIAKRRVNGQDKEYYVLRLPTGNMTVMIPTDTCENIGVRPIVDEKTALEVLSVVASLEIDMTSNWNQRYRDNMERLKTGNLFEVARVIKGLVMRDIEKGLSTGERKMLRSARQILVSEIALSAKLESETVETRLDRELASLQ